MPTTTTPDIIHRARKARAPFGHSGKWASIIPAVQILIARSFSLTEAIGWLVTNNAIPAAEQRAAYFAIAQRFRRAGISMRHQQRPKLVKKPKPQRRRKRERIDK